MRKRRPSTDIFPASARSSALGRALANVSLFPAPTGGARIKTIQAFSITIGASATSATATLGTAVNPTWAHVVYGGASGGDATDIRIGMGRLDLTNSTTVTATRASQNGSRSLTLRGFVIEWEPGSVKSVQQISISIANASTSNTQTINSVDTTKAFIIHNGSTGGSATEMRSAQATLTQTNATTITADRANGTNSLTVTGAVVEFN